MIKRLVGLGMVGILCAACASASDEPPAADEIVSTIGPFKVSGRRIEGRYTATIEAEGVAAGERPAIELAPNGEALVRRPPSSTTARLDPTLPLESLNRAALRAWIVIESPPERPYDMTCTFGDVGGSGDWRDTSCGGCCWQTDCLSSHISYMSQACLSAFF